jgi:predicted transcriptional regulator
MSDSRHSESLKSAESVGIITETRISGKVYSTSGW